MTLKQVNISGRAFSLFYPEILVFSVDRRTK